MKAKRRQELKTNDLAQAIQDLSEWFGRWGVYLVGGVAGVLVILVIVSYMGSAKSAAMTQAYADLRGASVKGADGKLKSDAEIEKALAKLGELGRESGDVSFKLGALAQRGGVALDLAMASTNGNRSDYLAQARGAYEEIVSKYKDRAVYYGHARVRLFQLEANEFVLDGDAQRKERAAGHLQELRNDPRFNGTPLQKMAVDTLNSIDRIFTRVEFPHAPPSTQPAAAAAVPINPTTLTPGQPLTVSGPTAVSIQGTVQPPGGPAPGVPAEPIKVAPPPPADQTPAEPAGKSEGSEGQ